MDDDGTDRGKKYYESINKEYDNLRKKFEKRMTRRHLEFDEDIFHDILVKCGSKFPDTYVRDIEGYIWTAYKRDCIRYVKKNLRFDSIDTGNPPEIPDDELDMDVNEFLELTVNEIKAEFGEPLTTLWLRYIEGEGYTSLTKESPDIDIKYGFRKIRNFIKNRLPKRNARFVELAEAIKER